MDIFKNRKLNKEKLLNFGFVLKDNIFTYKTKIIENQFELIITINTNNEIKTKLIEISTEDLYTLHLAKDVTGIFVSQIKDEYEKCLENISKNCFDMDIFKNNQTKKIIEYITKKYDDELEYLWE